MCKFIDPNPRTKKFRTEGVLVELRIPKGVISKMILTEIKKIENDQKNIEERLFRLERRMNKIDGGEI